MGYSENENFVEMFENDIELYLDDFCKKMNIEDIAKESQNRWNAALLHIQRYVFKPNKQLLKADPYDANNLVNNGLSNNGAYDIDKVNDILNIYIDLCYKYDKEISIIGFCNLTGIDSNTVYCWNNGQNRTGASTTGRDIFKKITEMREESLSNMALSGKRNPVGVIAVLNNKCGWADQKQVIKEERITIAPVSREALLADFGTESINAKALELPKN